MDRAIGLVATLAAIEESIPAQVFLAHCVARAHSTGEAP